VGIEILELVQILGVPYRGLEILELGDSSKAEERRMEAIQDLLFTTEPNNKNILY
jgi:hypothetical protein